MVIKAEVILDSMAPSNSRLTTICATYPRFIHSELMTHRMFSRNAASSRAIPVDKIIALIETSLAMPIHWGKNQKGMKAEIELNSIIALQAQSVWMDACRNAINSAKHLVELGVHKQITNRLLEPFMHMTTIITATEWENFQRLRNHKDAQPEIKELAVQIDCAMSNSIPVGREWHIPYLFEDEEKFNIELKLQLSTARCARVSYLTHDGKRDTSKDVELYHQLLTGSDVGHMSPFEHQAKALNTKLRSGNLIGWEQHRKWVE